MAGIRQVPNSTSKSALRKLKRESDKAHKEMIKARRKELISLAFIVVLLMLAAYFLEPGITGLLVGGEPNTYSDTISATFIESSEYTWSPSVSGELTRVAISGRLIGAGSAKVYLNDKLLYDSAAETGGVESITGYQVLEEQATEEFEPLSEEQPVEEAQIAEEQIEEQPAEETPSEIPAETAVELPPEELPVDESVAESPAEEPAVEEQIEELPIEAPLVKETPIEESPAETPVEEEPVEESPVEEIPVEIPSEEQPPEESPLEIPTEEIPVEEPLIEEIPPGETPAETPVEETPVEEPPVEEEQPAESEESSEEEPAITKPPVEEFIITFEDECIETCILDGLNESSYTIRVEVENATLEINTITYTIKAAEQLENQPPVFVFEGSLEIPADSTTELNLSDFFFDANGEPLTCIALPGENLFAASDSNVLILQPDPGFTGTTTLELYVSDGLESVISPIITVNVVLGPSVNETPIPAEGPLPQDTVQFEAEIGKPVKWQKKVLVENTQDTPTEVNVTVELPSYAENITVVESITSVELDKKEIKLVALGKSLAEYEKSKKEKAEKEEEQQPLNLITGNLVSDLGFEEAAEEQLVNETPLEEAVLENATSENETLPVNETLPLEELPVEAPIEEIPVEEQLPEEVPIEEQPTEELPAEEQPVEEAPLEEGPAEEAPAEETLPVGEELPAEEILPGGEELPPEELPAEELPVDDDKLQKDILLSRLLEPGSAEEYTVEYYTAAPQVVEEILQNSKKLTIYTDIEEVGYTNILTYTSISESAAGNLRLYWYATKEDYATYILGDALLAENLTDESYKVDITTNPIFAVSLIDTDNNTFVDRVQWLTPHLSNQTFEISLVVLNPYSYLRDGETWIVAFNTTGIGNLTISSPNAGWTEFLLDDTETFDEMRFIELKCGEENLDSRLMLIGFDNLTYNYSALLENDTIDIQKLQVADYECNSTGYLSNHMLKAGYATLMFEFSNENATVTDYAYDPSTIPVMQLSNITSNQYPVYTNSTLLGWCSATDADGGVLSYEATWYLNNQVYEEVIPEYIDVGNFHSCGILTNGSAVCWGYGYNGQLGDGNSGTNYNQTSPVLVNSQLLFKSISAGGGTASYSHTCGVLINGSAVCWGDANYGQLGYGGTTDQPTPILVNTNSLFKSISAGERYTCGVLVNGSAMCWGYNNYGQIGNGSSSLTVYALNPTAVNSNSLFKSISAGYYHTCGVLINGSAMCWGYGGQGRLGDGRQTQRTSPVLVNTSALFKSISAGGYSTTAGHTCGVLINGSAVCWGDAGYGQLGFGSTSPDQNNTILVNTNNLFKSISAGSIHTCGVLINGSAMCWGYGLTGRLGNGATGQQNSPVFVNTNQLFKSISAGGYGTSYGHTCGVLINGSAVCWGDAGYGQLGFGSASPDQSSPILVNTPERMWPFYEVGASSGWCYQEFANESTACGALDSGAYSYDSKWSTPQNGIDGNWGTATAYNTMYGEGHANMYVNYTLPPGYSRSSKWEARIGTLSRQNITINSSCWDYAETTGVLEYQLYSSYSSSSCLYSDTLISTPEGQRKISELNEGDFVYSYHEGEIIEAKILSKIITDSENLDNKLYNIETSSGNIINATWNHHFYANSQWIVAKDLKEGDILLTEDLQEAEITNISITNYSGKVYDISVEGTRNFFANNILVHNADYKAFIYCKTGSSSWTKLLSDIGGTSTYSQIYEEAMWWDIKSEVNVANITYGLEVGQEWMLECRANDYWHYSDYMNSSNVTIENIIPVMQLSNITSNQYPVYSNSTLMGWCNATDGDEHNVSYSWKWFLNGEVNESGSEATSAWCYQEFANVSTECGGLATGTYTGAPSLNNANDGSWVTEGHYVGMGGTDYTYTNYTLPQNSLNSSLLNVQIGHLSRQNLTIPSACWNEALSSGILQIRISSSYDYSASCSCLPPETLISTPEGQKEIWEIEEGEYVYSYQNGSIVEAKVISHSVTGSEETDKELYEIITSGGQIINATWDHHFFVEGEWVMARDLKIGDTLLTSELLNVTILNISIYTYNGNVHDLTIEGSHNFYANDILVHNIMYSSSVNCMGEISWTSMGLSDCSSKPDAYNIYEEAMWWDIDNTTYHTSGSLINVANITSDNLEIGQNWTLECTAFDGYNYSAALNSSNVTIENIIPVMQSSNITSNQYPVYSNSTLLGWCNATDGDEHNVSYSWKWFLNGEVNASGSDTWYYEEVGKFPEADYNGSWNPSALPEKAYDNNWLTYGSALDGYANLFINYTKPAGANSNSLLSLANTLDSTENSTIPLECWEYGDKLVFMFESYEPSGIGFPHVYCYCYQTKSQPYWTEMSQCGSPNSPAIYETAMWWQMEHESGSLINVANITSDNLEVGQNWTLECTAFDGYNYSAALNSSNVTIENHVPILSSISAGPVCLKTGTVTVLTSGASDEDDHPLILRAGSSSGISDLCNSTSGSPERSCTFTVQSFWTDTASHTIYGRVTDGWDNSDPDRTTSIQTDNSAPTPDPATIASVAPTSTSALLVTATSATDAGCNGTVQYQINRTSPVASTGWQSGATWSDTGRDCFTNYSYTVQYRDGFLNLGTVSSSLSAYPIDYLTCDYGNGALQYCLIGTTCYYPTSCTGGDCLTPGTVSGESCYYDNGGSVSRGDDCTSGGCTGVSSQAAPSSCTAGSWVDGSGYCWLGTRCTYNSTDLCAADADGWDFGNSSTYCSASTTTCCPTEGTRAEGVGCSASGAAGTEYDRDTSQARCEDGSSSGCSAQTWVTDLGTWAGSNYQCCGDDSGSDSFSTYTGSLTSSASISCERCNAGSHVAAATYCGNGNFSSSNTLCSAANKATATSGYCYYGDITCSYSSAANGPVSGLLYGNGNATANKATANNLTCYYGDITCADNSYANGTSGSYCGNGYFSSSNTLCSAANKATATSGYCYYNDIICTDGSASNSAVSSLLYGNGYWTSTTCYYGDITCTDGSSSSGTTVTLNCSATDSQCCPTEGTRAEAQACNDGSYGGATYDRDTTEARCEDGSSSGCSAQTWLSEGTGTGSDCCGDDSGEDFEQASGAGRSCCYNAAPILDDGESSSVLCENGQLYDCGSQVSIDGSVDTESADCALVGDNYCDTDTYTWIDTIPDGCTGCIAGDDCEGGICVEGTCRASCASYSGVACSANSAAYNHATTGGICLSAGTCDQTDPTRMDCGGAGTSSCQPTIDSTYDTCTTNSGDSCDSETGGGNFSQNGLCADSSGASCIITGFVIYDGANYQASADPDAAVEGDTCDETLTDGDFSAGAKRYDSDDAVCDNCTSVVGEDSNCEQACGADASSDEKAPAACDGTSGFIGGNCSYYSDGDYNSTVCSCVKGGAGYWSLGGETAQTSCCSDDASEYRITETAGTDAPSGYGDAITTCCNVATDCTYDDTCTAVTGVSAPAAPSKAYCGNSNTWYGGDHNTTTCSALGGTWLTDGTGTNSDCCGDDTTNDDFEQTEGAGRTCCYNGAVLADAATSSSIMCSNGQMYDCGGVISSTWNDDVSSGSCTAYEGKYCNGTSWITGKPENCDCTSGSECDSLLCIGGTCEASCASNVTVVSLCSYNSATAYMSYGVCTQNTTATECDTSAAARNTASSGTLYYLCSHTSANFGYSCDSGSLSGGYTADGVCGGTSHSTCYTDYASDATSSITASSSFGTQAAVCSLANNTRYCDAVSDGAFVPGDKRCDGSDTACRTCTFTTRVDTEGLCESGCGADASSDEKAPDACDSTTAYINTTCGYWNAADSLNYACACIMTGTKTYTNYWNIGGETNATACCQNTTGEYVVYEDYNANLDTAPSENDFACCSHNTDCNDDDTCRANTYASTDVDSDGDNDYCNAGQWVDCSTDSQCNTAAGYYCSGNDCTNGCSQNSDCNSGFFCNSSQICQAQLSDGTTCVGVTYVSTGTEEDAACTSGYCDNDGDGLSDDNHCYTPTGTNSRYDNQEETYCEYDAGNGADIFSDERQGQAVYDNTASASEYYGCPAYSSCAVGTTTCTSYDGDQQSIVCIWVSGNWTTITTGDIETDSTDCGAGVTNCGDGTASNGFCCGDDANENFLTELTYTGSMAFDDDEDACCDSLSDCVAGEVCYSSDNTPTNSSEAEYAGLNLGGDDNVSYCYSHSGIGKWLECDSSDYMDYWCGWSCGPGKGSSVDRSGGRTSGVPDPNWNAVYAGETDVGEYSDTSTYGCCGDDFDEAYLWALADASMDNSYSTNTSDDACCLLSGKCVDSMTCYSSGNVSHDADSDGDNDYCNAGTWYDCNTNAECPANSVCVNNDCVNTGPIIIGPTITPASPNITSNLQCNATAIDAQNATLIVEYFWYNGSNPVFWGNRTNVANNTNTLISTLGAGNLSQGDVWNCTVRAFDGTLYSTYNSSKVTIGNTAPNITGPSISPSSPNVTSTLNCTAMPGDLENTSLRIEWWWYNGTSLKFHGNTTATKNVRTQVALVGPGNLSSGQTWNCTVRTFDGWNYSAINSSKVTIGNLAPNITGPIITPTTTHPSVPLTCNATAGDTENSTLTVEWWWYNYTGSSYVQYSHGNKTGVQRGVNTNITTLGVGNLSIGTTWNCTVRAFDGSLYSAYNSSTKSITNSVPSKPVLSYPEANDTLFTNRTPRFNWTASTDADGDPITYHIEISTNKNFAGYVVNVTGIGNTYYIMPTELDFTTYWWRVRANDTYGYSVFSDIWNFTLVTSPQITLLNANVLFGTMQINTENDTSNNNPLPFKIENTGNIEVNISVNASALWQNAALNTSYYQFKANRSDEANSFAYSLSATSWLNMSGVPQKTIVRLNHTDANDVAALDIRIRVPTSEPAVQKSSTVTFIAEATT